jgi:hypothetical protein
VPLASSSSSVSSPLSSADSRACNRIPIVNLFHPNDPVASRLEPLLDPSAALIPPAPCTNSSQASSSSTLVEHGEVIKLMAHVRSLVLERMHSINWADVLSAGQFSSARLMYVTDPLHPHISDVEFQHPIDAHLTSSLIFSPLCACACWSPVR